MDEALPYPDGRFVRQPASTVMTGMELQILPFAFSLILIQPRVRCQTLFLNWTASSRIEVFRFSISLSNFTKNFNCQSEKNNPVDDLKDRVLFFPTGVNTSYQARGFGSEGRVRKFISTGIGPILITKLFIRLPRGMSFQR